MGMLCHYASLKVNFQEPRTCYPLQSFCFELKQKGFSLLSGLGLHFQIEIFREGNVFSGVVVTRRF